jgi:hypothetical protein
MWSIWGLMLKFGVKRALESCQNLGQKDGSELAETETAQYMGGSAAVVWPAVPWCAQRQCRCEASGSAGLDFMREIGKLRS